jgi:hypothetical protein
MKAIPCYHRSATNVNGNPGRRTRAYSRKR